MPFTWYAEVATPQMNPSGKVSYKRGSSYSYCPIARGRRTKRRHSFVNILSYVNRLNQSDFATEKEGETAEKECEGSSNMLLTFIARHYLLYSVGQKCCMIFEILRASAASSTVCQYTANLPFTEVSSSIFSSLFRATLYKKICTTIVYYIVYLSQKFANPRAVHTR